MQPYHEGLGPKLQKELQDLRDQGLYKKERILVSPQGAEITLEDGRVVINGVTGEAYGVAEEFVIPALQSLLRGLAGGARSAGPALLDLLHRFRLNPQLLGPGLAGDGDRLLR